MSKFSIPFWHLIVLKYVEGTLNARTYWKAKLAVAAVTVASLTVPAFSQVGIVIGRNPPPPMRWERRPPPPGPGSVWIDGFWSWRDGRYVWIPGHWDRSPYAGAYWSHGHWDHYPDGWHWHEGHWDREDHDDHYWEHHDHDRDRDDRDRR